MLKAISEWDPNNEVQVREGGDKSLSELQIIEDKIRFKTSNK